MMVYPEYLEDFIRERAQMLMPDDLSEEFTQKVFHEIYSEVIVEWESIWSAKVIEKVEKFQKRKNWES